MSENEEYHDVNIFWDFASTQLSSAASTISTYEMVKNIRASVAQYGSLISIKAYWDYDWQPVQASTTRLRTELSASGVSLIDCPGNGRVGVAIKKMLADMIFHAWDHPVSHTLVVITNDRDIAYALALLEMRNYRIVLISPAGTHADLTSQASAQIDWSQVVLGIGRGVNNERPSFATSARVRPSARPLPSSSIRPRGSTFLHQEVTTHELNVLPQRDPPLVFFKSTDPGFDVFDNENLHAVYMTSPKTMGSLGLGDGPLFPRPQSGDAAKSRSHNFDANAVDPASLNMPSFDASTQRPKDTTTNPLSPIRDQPTHPKSELGDDGGDAPLRPRLTPTPSELGPSRRNSTATIISHPESMERSFTPIEMPAMEDSGRFNTTDSAQMKSPAIVPVTLPDVISWQDKVNDGSSQPQVTAIDTPLPDFMPLTPIHTPSLLQPTPTPEKWMPLITVLRKSNGIARGNKLVTKVINDHPCALTIAGHSRDTYIDNAIKEGIVERYIERKSKNKQMITLVVPSVASAPEKWLPLVDYLQRNGKAEPKLIRKVLKNCQGANIDMAIRDKIVERCGVRVVKEKRVIRLTEKYASEQG